MKVITVKRTHFTDMGVFGVMDDDKGPRPIPFAVTLEHPRLYIPKGEYLCRKDYYHKGQYDTYEIRGVENRERILFHKGNVSDDSQGCILVAEQFGILKGRVGIISSEDGFSEFMSRLRGEQSFKLVILEV